jgi:hypothetical protein
MDISKIRKRSKGMKQKINMRRIENEPDNFFGAF